MRTLTKSLALALMFAGCTKSDDPETDGETQNDDTYDSTPDVEFDDDSSFATANDVRGGSFLEIDADADFLNYLQIGEGVISPREDRDFYVLTLEADVTYSFAILAYALQQQVVLDSVLRLYDGDENLLATNDDMPFRFLETDSAIYYTPAAAGDYYLEVLEFGDWWINDQNEDDFGGQVSPDGGSDFEYRLFGAIVPNLELDPNEQLSDVLIGGHTTGPGDTDSDTDSDTDADTDADTDVPDTDVDPGTDDTGFNSATSDYYLPSLFAGYNEEFAGLFEADGDVDYWPVDIQLTQASTVDYAYIALSGWPGYPEGTRLSLVDSEDNVLATTTEVIANNSYDLWFDDVGLISRVTQDTIYYIKAENDDGLGAGDRYPTMKFIYLPSLGDPEDEEAGNDSQGSPGNVPIEVSPNDPSVFTASIWGELPPEDTEGDWFHLSGADTNGLDGKYVQAWFKSNEVGSQLDAKITLYDSTGTMIEEFLTDAEFDDSLDPNVRDHLAEGEDLYIHVDAEARGDEAHAHQYIMAVIVTNDRVFN